MKKENIKKFVKDRYGAFAQSSDSCCSTEPSCCGSESPERISRQIGYSDEELNAIPEGANMGLGCGNPVAIASLKEGETVLDLGSGAGMDCFLAANKVGKSGKVIGVDMTPEMINKARINAKAQNYDNVEFRQGEIENLPIDDGLIDVIISNCVINLSPDKLSTFQEAFRVLKPGGRLMVADIVLTKELPEHVRASVEAYVGCIGGAVLKDDYLKAIKDSGFEDVQIQGASSISFESLVNDPGVKSILESINLSAEEAGEISRTIESIRVAAIKPEVKSS
jgi:SAM-dependent methyltransferase